MALSAALIRSTIVVAVGGLLFGFDTAVIAGTTDQLQEVFRLSEANLGFTVASARVGTILGSIFGGIPGDKYGRRDSLHIMAVLYVISAAGCAVAWDWPSLLVFRCRDRFTSRRSHPRSGAEGWLECSGSTWSQAS